LFIVVAYREAFIFDSKNESYWQHYSTGTGVVMVPSNHSWLLFLDQFPAHN